MSISRQFAWRQSKKKKIWAAAAALVVLTASACGANHTSEPSASLTGSTKLPVGTIGVLPITEGSELIARLTHDIEAANAKVGWKTSVEDGKGDPAVLGQAMTNFIAQGVDAIVVIGVDSAAIAPKIKQAKEAGIPVIAAASDINDPTQLYTAEFSAGLPGFVDSTVEYLKKRYPHGADYVQVDIPEAYAAHGYIVAMDEALDKAGFTLLQSADGKVSDLVNSMTAATTNVVQGHPTAKILISCCDFTPPVQTAALKAAGRSDILLVGRFDNLSSLKLFKEDANMVLGASNMTTGAMRALDAVYAYKASGTKIPTDNPQSDYEFAVVDKANSPAPGKFYYDPGTQIDAWVAKWAKVYSR